MVRKVVAVVLSLVAVVFFIGPVIVGKADTDRYSERLDTALFEDDLNNERTEGAPQQQVVNGWTTIDLLTIEVEQNNDMLELQYRQLALLLVLALLLAWSVLSQQDTAEPRHEEVNEPDTSIQT